MQRRQEWVGLSSKFSESAETKVIRHRTDAGYMPSGCKLPPIGCPHCRIPLSAVLVPHQTRNTSGLSAVSASNRTKALTEDRHSSRSIESAYTKKILTVTALSTSRPATKAWSYVEFPGQCKARCIFMSTYLRCGHCTSTV